MTNKPKDPPSSKKASGKNALLHGLYAKDVLMPWDSKKDFLQLLDDLKAEWSPTGRSEEEAVLDLAFEHWRKRTLWRLWVCEILSDPYTEEIIQTEQKSWSGIRQSLQAAASDERNLRGMIEATLTAMLSEVNRLQAKISTSSDQAEIKLLGSRMEAILKAMTERLTPLVQTLTEAPNAVQAFDRTHSLEGLEKLMRLETASNARIAKVLSRLVGLKEFKRTPAGGARMTALEASKQ